MSFSSVVNARNNGADPSRTIDWSASDGTSQSAIVTSTVTIPDAAPVVTAGAAVGYTEQGAAVTLDSALTVTDIDNTTLTSATVSIAAGFLAGDTLAATTTGTNITASYKSGTGVFTLTGSDSLANYQSVLASVTYSSSVADARGANGADPSRTIDWSASDGTSQSAVATSTVTIPDAAPVVTAGAAVSYTEQGAAVKLNSGLTVTDIDNATLTGATVSIAAGFLAGDTLAATTTGTSITQGYNISSGVLTLTGSDTLAHYKTVLESVIYSSSVADARGANGADPSRTIDWSANDGTSQSAIVTSTVNIPDKPPVITAGAAVSYTEQGAAVTLDSALTVTDIDNATLTSATVSIAAGFLAGDTLAATTTGTSTTASYNGTTGILTLTGSDTPRQLSERARTR